MVLAYLPALSGEFLWDDDLYVSRNPALETTQGLWNIWFKLGETPQYYPLVFTSFWLEYRLWGLDPTGYHAVNVLLHALNALLLWRLLRQLETTELSVEPQLLQPEQVSPSPSDDDTAQS